MYIARSNSKERYLQRVKANECGTENLRELLFMSLSFAVIRAADAVHFTAARLTAKERDTDRNSRKFSVPFFA